MNIYQREYYLSRVSDGLTGSKSQLLFLWGYLLLAGESLGIGELGLYHILVGSSSIYMSIILGHSYITGRRSRGQMKEDRENGCFDVHQYGEESIKIFLV